MINIRTRTEVKGKSTTQIYDWLVNLDEKRYINWHPAHKGFRRIREVQGFVGSILYFDEVIGGLRVNYKWNVL